MNEEKIDRAKELMKQIHELELTEEELEKVSAGAFSVNTNSNAMAIDGK
jgi:hypothetical protein